MNNTQYIAQGLLGAATLFGLALSPAFAGQDHGHGHGDGHDRDHDKTVMVNCVKGQSIGAALATGRAQRTPLTILVKGVCHENVTITADDVTIKGITPDAGISGVDPDENTVLITGASRVSLIKLAITNGRNGVAGVNGAGYEIKQCHVHGNNRNGILTTRGSNGLVDGNLVENNAGRGVGVQDGSHATVINNTVRLNGTRGVEMEANSTGRIGLTNRGEAAGNIITQNGEEGVEVANGSNGFLFANTITNNGQDGVALYQSAAVRLLGQNLIEGNARHGVLVSNGSALLQGQGEFVGGPNLDTIRGNTVDGIRVFNGSSLDVHEAVISANGGQGIRLDLHGSLRLRNSTIEDNAGAGIYLRRDSGMLAQEAGFGPIVLSGNGGGGVDCIDTESSLNVSGTIGPDPISPTCTGF